MSAAAAIVPSIQAVNPPPSSAGSSAAPFTADTFFHDVFEIINPLQHIPIVSTIYRELTGDKIGPVERIAGDTLYGGMIGFVSSVANVLFQEATGKDFGDAALAMLGMGGDKRTAVAANTATAQPAPSHVATAAPVQLIPVAVTPASSTQVQPGVVGVVDNTTSTLMNSLNRNGTGLDLGSPESPPVITSALDGKNTNALLASLNRNGIGLDTGPAASTVVATAPLALVATNPGAPNDDINASTLMASINHDGIGTDLGLRAMYAYRKSLALPANAAAATLH